MPNTSPKVGEARPERMQILIAHISPGSVIERAKSGMQNLDIHPANALPPCCLHTALPHSREAPISKRANEICQSFPLFIRLICYLIRQKLINWLCTLPVSSVLPGRRRRWKCKLKVHSKILILTGLWDRDEPDRCDYGRVFAFR